MCGRRRQVPDTKPPVPPPRISPRIAAPPPWEPPLGPPPASETDEGTYTPASTRSSISIPNTEPDFNPVITDNPPAPPPFPPAFRTPFASLKLQQNDTLIVHQFSAPTVGLVRGTIIANWPKGIQKEDLVENGHSMKLKGNPWLVLPQTTVTIGETVLACRLLAALLDALSGAGWVLTLSSGSAAGLRQHKPTLLFRHQDPAPAPLEWMVLSTLHVGAMDTLRVIDGSPEFRKDLAAALEDAKMTRRHGRTFDGVYDIELGRHRCTTDNVNLQDLMLLVVSTLDAHGFTVAASVDQACDVGKPDTWYCCRAKTWEVGMPVFHR